MKYRKLPVVIEAVLWTGNNHREIFNYLTNTVDKDITLESDTFKIVLCNGGCQTGDLFIKTLEGDLKANIGDYIIKGVHGEYYACKPDIFKKTYELVKDQ